MTASAARPLPRFIAVVLAWLPAAFIVWYFAAPLILWPAKLLVEAVARGALPDIVEAVEQHGRSLTFATTLRPGQAIGSSVRVAVDVDMLLYSFGLPMYAALVLAAREPRWPRALAMGYAAVLPVVAWGAIADFLKSVAITSGPAIASQTSFSPLQIELVAFAYQLGSLILPTVVPAATWVLMHRGLLERLRAGK